MIEPAVSALCEYFQTDYVLPVGSGSSGIQLALQLLESRRRQVVVPAAGCANIIVAVLAAGATPVPADIRFSDFTLSPAAVAGAISESTGAILAVDSFGCPADMDALRQASGRHPVLLIEDACQAYGGSDGMRKMGMRGDIGVISFGYSKPLDLGGGGILISRSRELHDELRSRAARGGACTAEWKNRLAVKLMKTDAHGLFIRLSIHAGLLRYPFPPRRLAELNSRWREFASEIDSLRALYAQILASVSNIAGALPLASSSELWLPWRLSFTVPAAKRDMIVAALRQHGIATSQLYRPFAETFHFPSPAPTPCAREMSDSIINLVCPSRRSELSLLRDRLDSFVSKRSGT